MTGQTMENVITWQLCDCKEETFWHVAILYKPKRTKLELWAKRLAEIRNIIVYAFPLFKTVTE